LPLRFEDRCRRESRQGLRSPSIVLHKALGPLAKRPFGGPQQVLSYLANYTHRVALSPRRPHSIEHVGDDGGGFGVPVGKESARLSFYIKLENYRPSRPCGRVKSSAGPMGTMRVGLMSS